jgi:hypothetical protein
MKINMYLIFQYQESSRRWPSLAATQNSRLNLLFPKMKICAIFGMVTSVALARTLPNDTEFDDILTDAAHGVLEVKYRLYFHVLRIIVR